MTARESYKQFTDGMKTEIARIKHYGSSTAGIEILRQVFMKHMNHSYFKVNDAIGNIAKINLIRSLNGLERIL